MLVTNFVCLYSRRGPARSSYQRWRYRDWKRLWCFWRAGSRRWWNSNLLYLQHNRKICNGDDYFKTRRNWFNASVRSTSVRAIMNILIYFLTKMMVWLYFFLQNVSHCHILPWCLRKYNYTKLWIYIKLKWMLLYAINRWEI